MHGFDTAIISLAHCLYFMYLQFFFITEHSVLMVLVLHVLQKYV